MEKLPVETKLCTVHDTNELLMFLLALMCITFRMMLNECMQENALCVFLIFDCIRHDNDAFFSCGSSLLSISVFA